MTDPESGRLDPRAWFRVPGRPLEVEIGSGKGTFLLETAKANPEINYLGIEWAREFYLYTSDRVRRAGLTNVRTLRADAAEFFRWRCPSGLAHAVHLYFSDPWPKRKHHKNRVVQHRFLAEVWRVLIAAGELRIVTDHDGLWGWCEEHFAIWTDAVAFARWREAGSPPHRDGAPMTPGAVPAIPSGATPFERLPFTAPEWVGEGETVGTNYERKMCVDRPPHACVLRKPP